MFDTAKMGIMAVMTVCVCGVWAQKAGGKMPMPIDTVNTASVVDTSGIVDTVDTVDTVNTSPSAKTARLSKAGIDTVDVLNIEDDELERAALAVDSVRVSESPQKLDLIRREYEYKRQTRLAIVMMAFIAAALATSQSWNPR
ncbi:MAG: hypothetical protein LBH93_08035 [Chitinispirillales bacterium]|jgi:hypothetical protein|nr:hypothetical protein [Chitinispirillales bacterium]